MKYNYTLKLTFFIIFIFFTNQKTFAQCFEIESILVDACDNGGDEGLNEMVRFKVGGNALNTSNLSVNWPSNAWKGLIINATTTSKVATLNAQIIAAGGCGKLIEPTGGVLPANAKVILVTSYNLDTVLNAFGAISEDIYIIFQDNPSTTGGHFGNFGTSATRTLSMTFGVGCSDIVTYNRALLIDSNGNNAAGNGATVNFTPSGTATYVNNGCQAPVDVFAVEAGTSPVSQCPGTTIALSGTAEGQQSVIWSAPSGSFSSPNTLVTNYTIDPAATGTITLTLEATNSCGKKTDTVIINVNSGSSPTFTAVPPICSGENLAALPTTSNNLISGSWSPALDNTATKTYTFTPDIGQCASSTTLTITVNSKIIPTFTAVPPICSGVNLSPLPTTSNNSILGSWSPVLDNTATKTYTFTPNTGQCASTTTMTITVSIGGVIPTFTAVPAICSGESLAALPTTSNNSISGIWSPVLDNTATRTYTFTPDTGQCASSTTITITVNSKTIPTFTAVPPICSGENLSALPTTSNNSILGSWSPALDNTATKTYTFTPNTGQCASTTTMTITVNTSGVIPTFTAITPICSGESLAALPTTSNNSIIGTWSPALDNTSTKTYTFTPNISQCASTTTMTITVNSKIIPIFNAVPPICSGESLSPLPTVSNNSISGSWSPALDNSATKMYTFTPDVGQCGLSTTLTITVNSKIIPAFIAVTPICSGQSLLALPSTSNNLISGTWSPVLDNTVTKTYTFTPDAGQCATNTTLTVEVYTNETTDMEFYLCSNNTGQITPVTIDTNLPATAYNFVWTLNGNLISTTTPSLEVYTVGLYQVTATSISGGCSKIFNAEVKKSIPVTAIAKVETDFNNQQQIIVTVSGGLGNYEYQLDAGMPQSSNLFNVSQGGSYQITVIDKQGCNNFNLIVNVLNYPRFFTPNADGYNDTWNIGGLIYPEKAVIYIFDRYGKLLKQISPQGKGWDGTYNGKQMPSNDYWFKISYEETPGEKKEFRAHFSLKR